MGCRTRRPHTELTRFTIDSAGRVHAGRPAPGRGAWLCTGSAECLEAAIRRRAFDRAWRRVAPSGALAELRHPFETTTNDMRDCEAAGSPAVPTAKG